MMKLIITIMIKPKLEYAEVVWVPHTHKKTNIYMY